MDYIHKPNACQGEGKLEGSFEALQIRIQVTIDLIGHVALRGEYGNQG
jgi:hypothetical protein